MIIPANIIRVLSGSQLFRTLKASQLRDIISLCREERYRAQDTIFRQGEFADKLYVIVDGAVALFRSTKVQQMVVTSNLAGKGETCGWSALVNSRAYTASAICQMDTRVISIEATSLRALVDKHPDLGFVVMKNLAFILESRIVALHRILDSDI